jgi:ribonuclease HII
LNRISLVELAAYLEDRHELLPEEEAGLRADPRRGARLLLERCLQRRREMEAETARLQMMLAEERKFWRQGIRLVAGVDEAGRGPLAGPVVAAAVILPPETPIPLLNDSKQLAPAVREKLFDEIHRAAAGVGIGIAPVEEIDRINIYGALMQAMRDALSALPLEPEIVLVDGFPIRELALRQKAIKGGDALSLSIAAASVVAKVTRDRMMLDLHRRYPAYGFDRHKGYATKDHRLALKRVGPCPAHRRSFKLSPGAGGAEPEEGGQ